MPERRRAQGHCVTGHLGIPSSLNLWTSPKTNTGFMQQKLTQSRRTLKEDVQPLLLKEWSKTVDVFHGLTRKSPLLPSPSILAKRSFAESQELVSASWASSVYRILWGEILQSPLRKVLSAQSCLNLCDPMDYSPPGSSVHGISQARILEWVAISSSKGSSWPGIELVSPALTGRFFTTVAPSQVSSKGVMALPQEWSFFIRIDQRSQNLGMG